MQRFWAVSTAVFLVIGALVMVGIVESWLTIETTQELAKWVCVCVVSMGLERH